MRYAEITESVIRLADGLTVVKNPTARQVETMRAKDMAAYNTSNLRGILTRNGGDLYVFSAYNGTHHEIAPAIGLQRADCIDLQLLPEKVYCHNASEDDVDMIRNHFCMTRIYGSGEFLLFDYLRNRPV
jgi:hypothetical protein